MVAAKPTRTFGEVGKCESIRQCSQASTSIEMTSSLLVSNRASLVRV